MRDILIQGAQKLNIPLSEAAIESFCQYYTFLEERNRVMNLTAITGEKDVAAFHFLDSLALLTIDDFSDKSVIDIGSGAGFPGVPMKIAEQSIHLTLLDAQRKRVIFMEDLRLLLSMPDIQCLHARAEEAAHLPELRGQFDFGVSRAVARLNMLSELCLPFIRTNGAFIAMKGTDSDEETREAENAILTLGAALESVTDYKLPGVNVVHRAVKIRKTAPTPDDYPRRYAKIEKKPL
ncbi:MAG: 16S rRNA (guanine(527)-N(7))-methyltransferase RsmG [Clostridiales bacterium]|jgi:16S rRNA (guanine527-N7)-methyltransferase|nr:16S rRNA (guanine(527)-N(7))-methyltransferase RsmG [Clostridiales bacterium]